MDEEEVNFFRFYRLCIRLGTKVVREEFNKLLPPSDLPAKLAAAKPFVNSIRGLITQKQKDLLYPTSGIFVNTLCKDKNNSKNTTINENLLCIHTTWVYNFSFIFLLWNFCSQLWFNQGLAQLWATVIIPLTTKLQRV